MSGARIYPPSVVEAVKAAVARGEPIRVIAARHGMSPSTVSNMSRNRIYRPLDDVKREQRARLAASRAASGKFARAGAPDAAEAAAVVTTPPVGVVAAAIAERSTGRPLVVETLDVRLTAAIPGAVVVETTSTRVVFRFAVWVDGARSGRIVTGHTSREAVDKAIALHGGRR